MNDFFCIWRNVKSDNDYHYHYFVCPSHEKVTKKQRFCCSGFHSNGNWIYFVLYHFPLSFSFLLLFAKKKIQFLCQSVCVLRFSISFLSDGKGKKHHSDINHHIMIMIMKIMDVLKMIKMDKEMRMIKNLKQTKC